MRDAINCIWDNLIVLLSLNLKLILVELYFIHTSLLKRQICAGVVEREGKSLAWWLKEAFLKWVGLWLPLLGTGFYGHKGSRMELQNKAKVTQTGAEDIRSSGVWLMGSWGMG